MPNWVDFLFLPEPVIDDAAWAKEVAGNADAASILPLVASSYASAGWTAEELKDALWTVGDGLGLNHRKVQAPVRVAITGRSVGPPLFESMEILGREPTVARIESAVARLGGQPLA